jgi:outer membrane protein assembly factor BamB
VLDAASGRRQAGAPHLGWAAIVTPRVLVVGAPVDDRAEDPECRYALRAWDARSGAPRWRAEVSTHFSKRDDKPGCSGLLSDDTHALGVPPDVLLATTVDGRPQAFDLTRGQTRWTSPDRGVPVDAGGRVVLVRERADRGPIRALDLATGRALWQAPDPDDLRPATVVLGDVVLIRGSGDRPQDDDPDRVEVFGAADGRLRWRSPPRVHLAGAGDGWFATTGPHHDTPDDAHDVLFYRLPG